MPTPAESLDAWARAERSVSGLVLIGSQARHAGNAVERADAGSDWDFQVISSRPRMFLDPGWTHAAGLPPVRSYATRTARIGRVPKVALLMEGAEADLVILPAGPLRLMRLLVALGRHRADGWTRRTLQDLALIIRPGWHFLKGAPAWEPFYRRVVAEVPDRRIGNGEASRLAACLLCDAVTALHRIDRGELLAAQRMLHLSLAETNFALLHELNLRRGVRSFPEARRIERVASAAVLDAVAVSAVPDSASLRTAVLKSAGTCDRLMSELLGTAWKRPHVPELDGSPGRSG